jgi:hypothetical protein
MFAQDDAQDVQRKLADVEHKSKSEQKVLVALRTGLGWPKCFLKHTVVRKALARTYHVQVCVCALFLLKHTVEQTIQNIRCQPPTCLLSSFSPSTLRRAPGSLVSVRGSKT